MRIFLLPVIIFGVLSIPAFADSVTILGGYVMPRGNSDIFTQNERETTFQVDDLNDFGATFGYEHFIGEFMNLGFNASFYDSDTNVEDRDFQFPDGRPILRKISLEIVPLEVSLRFLPAGREVPVIPYFGGGVGLYYWQYEEKGDFVFDRLTDPHVVRGRSISDGTDAGWHVEGGLQIPFSRYATFTAEVKYWNANGDLDTRSFDPNFEPIDLSATMIAGGVSLWF